MNVLKGMKKRPRKVLLYGTHGIGKTTWAAQAGKVIVLSTEDGGHDVGCDRTPLLRDLGSVNAWISDLNTQPHDYQWIAIDTLDWLEKLIFAAVCQQQSKKNIEDIGYAKGYVFALTHWEFVLKSLDSLMSTRNMGVILLAHSRIVKIEEPDCDTYTKYEPDLDKRSCSLLQEWADEVFFARYRVSVVTKGEGFDKRGMAIGSQERIIHTCEAPGYFAKRRIAMPDQIPLDFMAYLHFIKQAYSAGSPAVAPAVTVEVAKEVVLPTAPSSATVVHQPVTGSISGLIQDGSSKMPTPEWAQP